MGKQDTGCIVRIVAPVLLAGLALAVSGWQAMVWVLLAWLVGTVGATWGLFEWLHDRREEY